MEVEELTEEQQADLAAIRTRKAAIIREHRQKKGSGNNRPVMPAKAGAGGTLNTGTLRSRLGGMGLDPEAAIARARSQSRGRKRSR
jgi:nucleolar GTP-binding protein